MKKHSRNANNNNSKCTERGATLNELLVRFQLQMQIFDATSTFPFAYRTLSICLYSNAFVSFHIIYNSLSLLLNASIERTRRETNKQKNGTDREMEIILVYSLVQSVTHFGTLFQSPFTTFLFFKHQKSVSNLLIVLTQKFPSTTTLRNADTVFACNETASRTICWQKTTKPPWSTLVVK